jgi:hypothetical protein
MHNIIIEVPVQPLYPSLNSSSDLKAWKTEVSHKQKSLNHEHPWQFSGEMKIMIDGKKILRFGIRDGQVRRWVEEKLQRSRMLAGENIGVSENRKSMRRLKKTHLFRNNGEKKKMSVGRMQSAIKE